MTVGNYSSTIKPTQTTLSSMIVMKKIVKILFYLLI